ncbi:MAG TPA: hypothetical protein DD733_07040 [Clostridiales bacterium]|nr:hypothetical protein [Clostridiales bacterium]
MKLIVSDKPPWETDGLKYNNQQKGMGEYCLCKSCNNLTGTWYGEEYIKFVVTLHDVLWKLAPNTNDHLHFEIKQVKPLLVFKQVISMFCSTNYRTCEDERFVELSKFVLDKTSNIFNKNKYKLEMYLFGGGNQRRLPMLALLKHTLDFSECQTIILSEITTYPVGFVLYFDPPQNIELNGVDITSFVDCKVDDVCNLEICLPVLESQSLFPSDYRSRNDIIKCREENKSE